MVLQGERLEGSYRRKKNYSRLLDSHLRRIRPKLVECSCSSVQRSGGCRGDCLIACPLPNSGIEHWRVVVIVDGYTLFMTSYSRLQTNVVAKFVDTTCIFISGGSGGGVRPRETYQSNFIHRDDVQSGKQHNKTNSE